MLEEFEEMLLEHDRETLPGVLFVSSECAPLAKTGGLADVVGTLPKYLNSLGMDARVITPYHTVCREKFGSQVEHMFSFYVDLGWRHEYCGIEKLILNGVTIYLVDSLAFFGDKIYRGGAAEIEQYAFFQRAVLDAMPLLDFSFEIVHCNDWQAAMLPMLARTQYKGGVQEKLKYLLSIHNIAYQGKWNFDYIRDLLSVDPAYFTPEYIELNKDADFLKAGCVFADRLSTVSPNYANEIKTPYFGEGLEGILNARSAQLSGILNGIDTVVFNPGEDRLIPASYTPENMSGKILCRRELQKKLGLKADDEVPILGMVTRMTEQKGFELVMSVIDDLMNTEKLQFVLLGTGDGRYEDFMRQAENRFKGRLCSYIGYDEELAHLIYAGCDFFLMPSRFEPCGLSQMIAMRYGCLPIVRETGGLKDSVIPYNCITGEGTGFSFANFDAGEMLKIIRYALSTFEDRKAMAALIKNAMETDFSFERSAKEYVRLYISMLDGYHEAPPALLHRPEDIKFRKPFGAVRQGEKVSLSFGILSGRVFGAKLLLFNGEEKIALEMKPGKNRYSVSFNAPERCAAWRYCFELETKYGVRSFGPEKGGSWQLTVFEKDFETPAWFKASVMYQIFPDRFGIYSRQTALEGIKYKKALGQMPLLHKSSAEEVDYLPRGGRKDYYPDDFYGGTFKGIAKKLPYLKELGISCIYLNPIVEARSNHRYDAGNYLKPDPILGSLEDFETLCAKAKKLGIKIILDGVYSHTGSDSVYFNRFGHYGEGGACSGETSPYYSWYSFKKFPEEYSCWWGFEDLPEVDERNEGWQKFIVSGEDSVMKTWLRRGASGWRLDVADEIPDDVLALMRLCVKEEDPEAVMIGEVWEDPTTKIGPEGERTYALGRALDSVMNYPLTFALADFIHGRKNAGELCEFLLDQQMNYPEPLYYSLMNLLSSHDLPRIRTALATAADIRALSRQEQLALEIGAEALKRAVELEKLAATLQFALPGVPCIYYGDEQGMTGLNDPFNRAPFREDGENTGLFDFYAQLAGMRNSSKALREGKAKFIPLSADALAVVRFSEEETVIALVNRGENSVPYSINCSFAGKGRVKGKIEPMSARIDVV